MRMMVLAAACMAAAFVVPAAADATQQNAMKSCAASWKTLPAAEKAKQKYTDYMGTCMKAPTTAAAAPAPAMAMRAEAKPAAMKMTTPADGGSAKCKDGKIVTYKNRSGTCSGHGGVATWM
jgi:hypothetical protein